MDDVRAKAEGLSPLRGALLGMLVDAPLSGYDMTKIFDRTLGHVWSAKHSQIYPELATLLEEGLVRVRRTGARNRKEYEATAEGRRVHLEWLAHVPPNRSASRNEGLLHAFFLHALPGADALAFLHEEEAYHRSRLADYEEQLAGAAPGALVLEAGLRYERMMVDWAQWAAREVERLLRSDEWPGEQRPARRRRAAGRG